MGGGGSITLIEIRLIDAIKNEDYKVIDRDITTNSDAIRLNRKTTCAITGKCEDCYSPDCMCGQYVITRRSRIHNRIKVILVGEELGY